MDRFFNLIRCLKMRFLLWKMCVMRPP